MIEDFDDIKKAPVIELTKLEYQYSKSFDMKDTQELQEAEYSFPYHYLPYYDTSFHLTRVWKWGIQYIATIRLLIDEISKISFSSFIDVGCGDGRLVKEIHEHFQESKVYGIDTSKNAVNLAKALNPKIDFQAIDIGEFSPLEQYDIASCVEVIEHIPPDELGTFIKRLSYVLKANGHLFLTTPTINKQLSKKHFQHFTYENLYELLDPYFNIIKYRYIHRPKRVGNIMMMMLVNKWYVLNHPRLSNFIFDYYYNKVFLDKSTLGHRIFIVATRK